jgi:hypothetical protein
VIDVPEIVIVVIAIYPESGTSSRTDESAVLSGIVTTLK